MLLDTHTLLWFALNDANLSVAAQSHLMNPADDKLVSPATYWEIAIKIATNKYALTSPYEDFMNEAIHKNGFTILPIELEHTARVAKLPIFKHHKDPFDRLIVAQALTKASPFSALMPNWMRMESRGCGKITYCESVNKRQDKS